MPSFGYWLRRRRKALDLTQEALAERVSCSRFAIRKIEADERRPSRRLAERLADCLGIPAEERRAFLNAARGIRALEALTHGSGPDGVVQSLQPMGALLTVTARSNPADLLEREQGLQSLADWLDSAIARGGMVALVSGEAGIGKTTLLQEFCRRQNGVTRILSGACDALYTPRPLAPFHDIARQTQGALLTAMEAGDRSRIFNTTLDEFESAPALVVLEDLHWADEATLDLLTFVGRRIQRTRTLLVVTYREEDVGPRHPLRAVIGELPRSAVRRLHVAPLSQEAVARLARAAGRFPLGLHATTGGNPFFLTEVLASPAEAIPVTVCDAVLARVNRLPPAARAIAELVSIVPGRTEASLLEQAVCLEEAALDSCLAAGIKRDADGAVYFRHELARRALEDSLSLTRQQELHSTVLSVLEQCPGTPAARLAHHAHGARNTRAVLHWSPLAASHAAAVGAHREAAALYRLALRYAEDLPGSQRAELHERLSYECYLTTQIDSAIEARQAALEIWRCAGLRAKEGDTLRWLSRLSWFVGRRTDAEQYAAEAIAVLESLPAGPELAMAYSNRAQLDMLAYAAHSAIQWAQKTIRLAEPMGNDEILSHALNNLGAAQLVIADEKGWANLERSLKIALTHGFQEHAARAYTNLSSAAVDQHRYHDALRYFEEGLAYCDTHDLTSWSLYMLAWRARAWFGLGEWSRASTDAQAILVHPNAPPVTRIPALTVVGHLRIRRGDPDATTPLEQARKLAEQANEVQRLGPLAVARAEAAWLEGDCERIVREVQPVYGPLDTPWQRGELAVWLFRAGALDTPPNDIAGPYGLELSGNWRGAAEAWRGLNCMYEYATVLAWHGGEAEKRLALASFQRLGASAAVNAVRTTLHGYSQQRLKPGPPG